MRIPQAWQQGQRHKGAVWPFRPEDGTVLNSGTQNPRFRSKPALVSVEDQRLSTLDRPMVGLVSNLWQLSRFGYASRSQGYVDLPRSNGKPWTAPFLVIRYEPSRPAFRARPTFGVHAAVVPFEVCAVYCDNQMPSRALMAKRSRGDERLSQPQMAGLLCRLGEGFNVESATQGGQFAGKIFRSVTTVAAGWP